MSETICFNSLLLLRERYSNRDPLAIRVPHNLLQQSSPTKFSKCDVCADAYLVDFNDQISANVSCSQFKIFAIVSVGLDLKFKILIVVARSV
jgi:hypothetical protein